jgi:hypothetical protein
LTLDEQRELVKSAKQKHSKPNTPHYHDTQIQVASSVQEVIVSDDSLAAKIREVFQALDKVPYIK